MIDEDGLPSGWAWTTVQELGAVGEQSVLTGPFGASLGRQDFVESGVPVLTIGCLTESGLNGDKAVYITAKKAQELARYRVRQGDLLFSRMASVGRSDLITAEFDGALINYHLMRLRLANSAIEPRYFVYYVRGSEAVADHVRAVNHGATRDGINTEQLLELPVLLAPLAEQHRIVAAIEQQFTRLDAGVASLRRAQAALKRYRAAVLKAAVEGKLTEAWRTEHPDAEPASALLARILAERRARWEADLRAKGKDPKKARYDEPQEPAIVNLPQIPSGWQWMTLDTVLVGIQAGKNFRCDERPPEGNEVGVAKVSAVTWGTYDEDESKTVTDNQRIEERILICLGDFLFSRANTIELVGACVIVHRTSRKVMLSDKILRFTFADVLPQWVLWALRSRHGRNEIERLATGNQLSMRNISQESIRRICVPLPPVGEQEQIVAEVERRLSVVDELEAEVAANLKRAERLRQAILREAFAGRLVPQDPTDEPASVLIERIRQAQQAETRHSPRRARSGQHETDQPGERAIAGVAPPSHSGFP